MTAVRVVGLFGDDGGTSEMQIALSHRFGATPRDNARNTVWAVQNLLDGLAIDNYYMIDYSGVAVLNDALGGIEVTIPEDMTRVNPAWTEGTTVTLQGQEAEAFVRARKSVGSGTNAERMTRQNVFMQNAVARLKQKVGDSLSFADELVSMLQDLAVSNLSARQLASLLTDSYRFEVLPVDHPSGSYEIGKNGYMEFRMQEDSAVEWVLQHLYTKQS
jgi:LCP family protein required for cell wall assembly